MSEFINKFKKKEGGEEEPAPNQAQVSLPPEQSVSFEKTENKVHVKGKPGGGWDSDEDEDKQKPVLATSTKKDFLTTFGKKAAENTTGTENPQPPSNEPTPIEVTNQPTVKIEPQPSAPSVIEELGNSNSKLKDYEVTRQVKMDELQLLEGEQLDSKNFEHENKLTTDICQTAGARMRESEEVLTDFVRACEPIETPVIGSLLIAKLYIDLPSIAKIRAIFAEQELVKKYPRFEKYFKHHSEIIRQCPRPEDNEAVHFNRELEYLLILVDNPTALPPSLEEKKFAIGLNQHISKSNNNGSTVEASTNGATKAVTPSNNNLIDFDEVSSNGDSTVNQLTEEIENIELVGGDKNEAGSIQEAPGLTENTVAKKASPFASVKVKVEQNNVETPEEPEQPFVAQKNASPVTEAPTQNAEDLLNVGEEDLLSNGSEPEKKLPNDFFLRAEQKKQEGSTNLISVEEQVPEYTAAPAVTYINPEGVNYYNQNVPAYDAEFHQPVPPVQENGFAQKAPATASPANGVPQDKKSPSDFIKRAEQKKEGSNNQIPAEGELPYNGEPQYSAQGVPYPVAYGAECPQPPAAVPPYHQQPYNHQQDPQQQLYAEQLYHNHSLPGNGNGGNVYPLYNGEAPHPPVYQPEYGYAPQGYNPHGAPLEAPYQEQQQQEEYYNHAPPNYGQPAYYAPNNGGVQPYYSNAPVPQYAPATPATTVEAVRDPIEAAFDNIKY